MKSVHLSGGIENYRSYRLRIALGSILLYVVLFLMLHYLYFFTGLPIFAVIPVIVIAWLYGAIPGIIASMLFIPVNILMLTFVGISWVDNMLKTGGGISGTVGFILIAVIVGRLSDLGQRLHKELHEKQLIEAELKLHRESLEQLVNDKTRELQESRERFRAIAENSPDAIIITDAMGIILYCNRGAESIFGYAPEELLGQSSIIFLPPLMRETEQDKRVRYARSGEHLSIAATIESIMVRRDGTEFPVEFSLYSWAMNNESFFATVFRDITERKRAGDELRNANEALRLSRDFFQNVFNAAGDGIYVTDELGIIVFANKALCDMLGYDPGELIGMPAVDITADIPELPLDEALEHELYHRDYTSPFETFFLHKDGSTLAVESKVTNVREGSQASPAIIVILRDITERKRAENEIRQARDYFETILKTSPDAIFVANESGIIVMANESVFDVYGYRPEELIGQHVSVLATGDAGAVQKSMAMIEELYETGVVRNFVGERKRKDGTIVQIESSHTMLKNPDGAPAGSISSTRDVTDRKRLEEHLRQSLDYLENIFRASPDSIIVTDAGGYIVMASESVSGVYGYSPAELIGQHASIYAPDDERAVQKIFDMMPQLYEQGIVRNFTSERKRRDGRIILVETSVVLMKNPDGSVAGSVSSSRDITERKKLEEQLWQSQKMEAIGTLAGGIAHDFNNILTAIIGFTELSHGMAAGNSRLEKNLGQVLKAGDRARNLVKQILAFSRKSAHELKPIQTHLIIKEVLKLLRASIPSTIVIQYNISDRDDVVIADPTQIHQIIMNLCTNAAHAMQPAGGVLEIITTPGDIDEQGARAYADIEPGPYLQLSVKDTGTGIPGDIIGSIFEPFFTTKEVDKGTGMGLAVVYGIVKSLQGDITVYSEPGRGTVFHVLLPRVQDAPQGLHQAAQTMPQGSEAVLLVDDEAQLLDLGVQTLASLGYRATAMRSPLEALELFKNNPAAFDVVITDQTMPQLTGYELAKSLLQVRPDIPIILCTGYSDTVTEELALGSGIKAFIIKPLNRLILAETIRRVLDAK